MNECCSISALLKNRLLVNGFQISRVTKIKSTLYFGKVGFVMNAIFLLCIFRGAFFLILSHFYNLTNMVDADLDCSFQIRKAFDVFVSNFF